MPEDRRSREPVRAGSAIDALLASRGLLEGSREGLCVFVWREVAGEWYAQHTYVTSVRDGVLNVRCDSAPRAQQLQLDAPQIIARLNERLGEGYVREIRPSSAGIGPRRDQVAAEPEQADWPTPEELARIPVPPEVAREILEGLSDLDGPVRHRLEEMMLLHARVRAWQREHGWRECPTCGAMHQRAQEQCLACDPLAPPSNAGGEEGLSAFFE